MRLREKRRVDDRKGIATRLNCVQPLIIERNQQGASTMLRMIQTSILFLLSFSYLTACTTVTFVQPYDEALVTGSQKFYTDTAQWLEQSRQRSPTQRPDEEDPSSPGHVSQFVDGYNALMIAANGLIIRAMVNSVKVDELGQAAQTKVSEFIDERIPSVCVGNTADFGQDFASLTVQNFADLKCLVTNWQTQHENAPAKTLVQPDWARRHRSLMTIILEIQKAESFKQVESTI